MRDLCRPVAQERQLTECETDPLAIRAAQGLAAAALIAAAGWKARALTKSGAAAATAVGAAVYAGMGTRGSLTMVSYFAAMSALGKLPGAILAQQRGKRRDAVQVLANGLPAAVFSLIHAIVPGRLGDAATAGFFGSIATAAADTSATELGTRWGGQPRSIVTGRRASPGESGGVTPVGLAASIVASFGIAVTAYPWRPKSGLAMLSCMLGGLCGSLTDSLLGALVQERRWCATCQAPTELVEHTCGHRTHHLSGAPFVDNDTVNFLSVLAGGLVALVLADTAKKLTDRNGSRVEFNTTLTNSRLPGELGAP